jgi:hypothetical protein
MTHQPLSQRRKDSQSLVGRSDFQCYLHHMCTVVPAIVCSSLQCCIIGPPTGTPQCGISLLTYFNCSSTLLSSWSRVWISNKDIMQSAAALDMDSIYHEQVDPLDRKRLAFQQCFSSFHVICPLDSDL